jgi:hypothetical protein
MDWVDLSQLQPQHTKEGTPAAASPLSVLPSRGPVLVVGGAA